MDNKVIKHYCLFASARNGNFLVGRTKFFLEIDFYIKERNESALAHGVTLGRHHIPMEKKKLVLL